jgi:hypothetical protein
MGKNALIGTWRLVSFELRTANGETTYLWGRNPQGYLIYSQEGYMSVALSRAHRPNFVSGDQLGASTEEKVAAFDTYTSYAGKYSTKGDKLYHHAELSLLPNWAGVTLERTFTIEGSRLTISSPPIPVRGEEQTAHLIFERV